jgi:hypothetical protein
MRDLRIIIDGQGSRRGCGLFLSPVPEFVCLGKQQKENSRSLCSWLLQLKTQWCTSDNDFPMQCNVRNMKKKEKRKSYKNILMK